ncbi:MAG: hypothetical protein HUJ54_08090 [Erysipelotrichaceae bacterium]|nr:hypothetical protein [Erysipelotrichaceae bacterium]
MKAAAVFTAAVCVLISVMVPVCAKVKLEYIPGYVDVKYGEHSPVSSDSLEVDKTFIADRVVENKRPFNYRDWYYAERSLFTIKSICETRKWYQFWRAEIKTSVIDRESLAEETIFCGNYKFYVYDSAVGLGVSNNLYKSLR